jgi:signal transduction histidine kinase
MFLSRFKALTQGLRFRIAATYFTLVVVSSIILFGFLYFLLLQTLKDKDHRIILSDFKKFAVLADTGGGDAFKKWFDHKQNSSDASDVFARLVDKEGRLLFIHEPSVTDEIGHDAFLKAIQIAPDDRISRIESASDKEDAVEFYSDHLGNGMQLQVGKDTEDREELLGRFRDAFTAILIGTLLLALATAILFSSQLLRPIRNLIETIENVRRGNHSARADVRLSGDEINELAIFLNGMLTQNSKLIAALSESLDAVAHDLRTPLTRLRVHAERAIQEGKSDSDALGAILDNADQVIELLNAIFDVSEAEAGTMKLHLELLNIRQILSNVMDVYSVVAEDRQIVLEAGEMHDVEMRADVRLKQAVANLIDNAIKFSPNGSKITVSVRRTGARVVIGVADQGPGISQIDEPKIWERLYRGDASRTTRGMGLGLSLVRSLVVASGEPRGLVARKPI